MLTGIFKWLLESDENSICLAATSEKKMLMFNPNLSTKYNWNTSFISNSNDLRPITFTLFKSISTASTNASRALMERRFNMVLELIRDQREQAF